MPWVGMGWANVLMYGRSGAGIAGAQSIHANVYATQVCSFTCYLRDVLMGCVVQPVAKFATEEQRKAFLPRLIQGEWRTCFGVYVYYPR